MRTSQREIADAPRKTRGPRLGEREATGPAGGIGGSRVTSEERWGRSGVFWVAALALIAVLAANWVSLGFDRLRTTLINANWEFSWSHDVDTVLLAIGVLAAIKGSRGQTPRDRRLWTATAVILCLLFLDEASSLHATIGAASIDKLLYAPILLALVACLWLLTAGRPERVIVSCGVVVLFVSFAMHVAGLHLLRPLGYTNWLYQGGVGFKEGTELAGLVMVLAGLWALARRER